MEEKSLDFPVLAAPTFSSSLRIFSISALAFGSVVWSELSISILLKMCYEGKTIFRRFFE
jgi:hypothetical protein